MCNRYGYRHPLNALEDHMRASDLSLIFTDGARPNLQPRDDIRPTNTAPVLRPDGDGVRLDELRWWLIPFFHRKGIKDWKAMCTNARSETVGTAAAFREAFKRRRCLVPASHYYEWTPVDPAKPKGEKIKWRFARPDGGIFCFAGLWDHAETSDGPVTSFTILTCEPGADASPYHTRQPVILEPDQYRQWLDTSSDCAGLMCSGPAGSLVVDRAPAEASAA